MAARISEVCDGVRAFLATVIAPEAPDEVQHLHAAADALEGLEGKKVRIFPAGYGDAERIARRRVQREYRVAVVVEIPYLAAASAAAEGPVPKAWVDSQIAWIEENVFDPLNEAHTHQADGLLLGEYQTETAEVSIVYDPARLDTEKLFVSLVEVAYRNVAAEA